MSLSTCSEMRMQTVGWRFRGGILDILIVLEVGSDDALFGDRTVIKRACLGELTHCSPADSRQGRCLKDKRFKILMRASVLDKLSV